MGDVCGASGERDTPKTRELARLLACNRDDQARHFAFLMNDEGEWSLGPAYDLTYSEGMNGHHTTSVRGETSNPNWEAMHELCDEASVDEKTLRTIAEQVEDSVATFGKLAKVTGVSPTGIRRVERRMNEVRDALGSPRWKNKKNAKPDSKGHIIRINNITGILQAVEAGLGIGVVPDYVAAQHPALERVLPDVAPLGYDVHLVYADALSQSKRVAAFRDFAVKSSKDWQY